MCSINLIIIGLSGLQEFVKAQSGTGAFLRYSTLKFFSISSMEIGLFKLSISRIQRELDIMNLS